MHACTKTLRISKMLAVHLGIPRLTIRGMDVCCYGFCPTCQRCYMIA